MGELTLKAIKEEWKSYGLLIQQNRKPKNIEDVYSIIHVHFGKQQFTNLEELNDWLIRHEAKLAEYAGITPRNLLVKKYQDRQADRSGIESQNPDTNGYGDHLDNRKYNGFAIETPNELAIAGVEDDSVFDSESFQDIPEHIREVLKQENSSFYTSIIKPEEELRNALHCPTLDEALPMPEVIRILRNSCGLDIPDDTSRYNISCYLADLGFSVRFFGDPRHTELEKTLLCIAASK